MAILAVVIIIVAAAGVFLVANGGSDDKEEDTSNAHAVKLNGVEANDSNVVNGSYDIKRNLVLVTKGEPSGNVAAFLSWVTSEEGQKILGEEFVKLDKYTTATEPTKDGQTTITLGGSTSLSETAGKLTAAYMEKYPFLKLSVQGGGSGAGEKGADAGTFDIGMLSRDMGSSYEGNLVPLTIGQDGVAVIVNVAGVNDLTTEQVAKLFSGEIKNWKEVGGPDKSVQVIIREDGSGTRECFDKAMTAIDADWKPVTGAVSCGSTGLVISNVQTTEGSIGYISIGQVSKVSGGTEEEATAHAVKLNGVEANDSNVVNGSYDIKRNLVLVTKGEPSGNVAAFLSWVTSEEGQKILGEEFVKLDKYTTATEPTKDGQTTITLGGSTSLSETAGKLTAAYMEKYPFLKLSVQGGGSGAGEKGADAGTFDIGMLSRDMGSSYEGNLVPLTIGQDGVAVIVNVAGVNDLTTEQVAKLFSGEIKNWKEVGGPDKSVQVIIREDGSGTRECFDKAMTAIDADWKPVTGAVSCGSTGLVISNVQTTEGSIGYISIGQVSKV